MTLSNLKYTPRPAFIVIDFICWIISIFLFTSWQLIDKKLLLCNYFSFIIELFVLYLIVSYLLGRYKKLYSFRSGIAFKKLLFSLLICFLLSIVGCYIFNISVIVILALFLFVGFLDSLLLLLHYTYRYAGGMDEIFPEYKDRIPAKCFSSPKLIEPELFKEIKNLIENYSGKESFVLIEKWADLKSTNTKILATSTLLNVKSLHTYRYDCIINLTRLNDIRGINKMFCAINEKLPDEGNFICLFEPLDLRRRRFFKKYPIIINYLLYSFDFIIKRVLPNLLPTSRIYYDITKGKGRVFSKTEILGRLYYCGFEIKELQTIGSKVYVLAQRKQMPEKQERKIYGPLITLNRIGKNGRKFKVYKMRTMHPYSEYLQSYMYEKHDLQEGGKFKDDIRVSDIGKFMRKYWIDELPMFINLFKGEMKLIGVRPLSNQYFNLYSKDLQEKRTKFKPGLFPPFYADMPKTLDEIQASEMKYLTMCENFGVFRTDIKYLCKIIYNIVFRRARSK